MTPEDLADRKSPSRHGGDGQHLATYGFMAGHVALLRPIVLALFALALLGLIQWMRVRLRSRR